MAMPAKDLTGQRFGYLTVVRRAGTNASKCATWVCRCDCGKEVVRESQYLRTAHRPAPRSCGCRHGNARHMMSRSRPHQIWANMKRRCANRNGKDWRNYGGRGVVVCERWLESFENFWADMQHGYEAGLTLGRIDNHGPYSPQNCRWETPAQQSNNRRTNVLLDTPRGRMTTAQAAREFGLKPVTLYARLNRYGWPLEKALLTPSTTSSTADHGVAS